MADKAVWKIREKTKIKEVLLVYKKKLLLVMTVWDDNGDKMINKIALTNFCFWL